jgi:adenosine deaminase
MQDVHGELKAQGKDVDVRFLVMFPTDMFATGELTEPKQNEFKELKAQVKRILMRADAIGVDVAGPEAGAFTPEGMKRFAEVYDLVAEAAKLRKRPMVLRPHVGEGYNEGGETAEHKKVAQHNLATMLKFLQDRGYSPSKDKVIIRFGHATHAAPDQIRVMHDLGIIVEANIGSNLATESIATITDHPLLYNLYYGTKTILSTDAQGVMRTTMTKEFALADEIISNFKAGNATLDIGEKRLAYNDLPETIDGLPKDQAFSTQRLRDWARDYYKDVQQGDAADTRRH